jgi:Choline dehydrogenase and related flavoproteins
MDGHYDDHHRNRGGRRHPRPSPAPSGKRILLLERGDWLPREPENWSTVDVFVDGRYISRTAGTTRRAKSFYQPQVHYFVGGATKLYGAALYRMRAEDFGELRHHDGLSPAWPISYQDMEPLHRRRDDVPGARRAGRGSDRAAGQRALSVPGGLPRAADPATLRRPGRGRLSSVPRAVRHQGQRGGPAVQHLREVRVLRRLPCPLHAKSDAEVAGVRPALEHANVTLVRNARAVKLETNPAGTAITEVVVEHDGETERYQGDIVVVSCGAANSAKLLLASATTSTRTGWPTAPIRSAATSCTTTARPCSPCPRTRTRPCSRRPSAVNDFYFQRPGLRLPDGQHPDDRQVAGGDVPRREAPRDQVRADWALRDVAEHAVDFWLSTEDLPQPTTGSPSARTAASTWRTRRATPRPPSGCTTSSIRCWARSACTPATWLTGSRT